MSSASRRPRSLYDKVWDRHIVIPETRDTPAVIYVDLHLVHEVTSPQAFTVLRSHGLKVRRPDRTLATADHSTPTLSAALAELRAASSPAARQVQMLESNCREFGIELMSIDSERRGIVHVIGPELGATQPGKTIVCGDSHTSTHGAFGALAFGIGTTEVGHVLATQCLLQRKSKTMAVNLSGKPGGGVGAKDLTLAVIGHIGVSGGTGHVLEYRGDTVRGLSMEQRMTLCNMSIEAGAKAGMVQPDDTTFEYLANRPMAPQGAAFDSAVQDWRSLAGDEDASYDTAVQIDASTLEPMITYGTHPGMVLPITGRVPNRSGDQNLDKALKYMGLSAGEALIGKPVDVVFIGSCTNSRLSDLRDAAQLMAGRKVASNVRMLVVPGSQAIKRQAEAEGLHAIFTSAGAEWRESGCSMCIAMNGDKVGAGQYAVSTSNRNFEGRQGAGSRTFLASPITAAAAAVSGRLADPRTLLKN